MRRVFLVAVGLVALGCSSNESSAVPVPAIGSQRAAIINGMLDPGHPAVVAVLSMNSECSGTVISVVNGTGYVLTAGHCVPKISSPPQEIIVGPDYQTGVSYKVTGYLAHPQFKPNAGGVGDHDFAMVKFSGAPAGMATIPPLTKDLDTLKHGDMAEIVGYGATTYPPGANSKKHLVDMPIDDVGTIQLGFDGSKMGFCEGDSGGPGLVTVNGVQYVAGVTSYGQNLDPMKTMKLGCNAYEVQGRVSTVYDDFIKPYIETGTPGMGIVYPKPMGLGAACSACLTPAEAPTGMCGAGITACTGNLDCSEYEGCTQLCIDPLTNNDCYKMCATDHPQGAMLSNTYVDCLCFQACPTQCTTECNGPKGMCGFTLNDGACKTCMESKCCAEGSACYGDQTCLMCENANTPDPSCKTNGPAQAYEGCITKSCATECMVMPGAGGSGGSGGSGTAGSTSAGGKTGTGGSTSAGGSTSMAGSTSAGGTNASGGTTGGGGSAVDSAPANDGTSGKSGGCSVTSNDGASRAPAALLGIALALASVRRRKRRALVGVVSRRRRLIPTRAPTSGV